MVETTKEDMQAALSTLYINFNKLNDLMPHPCGATSDAEIYCINIKAEIDAAIILADNLGD